MSRRDRQAQRDDLVTKDIELSKLVEPKFVTLVKNPANEIAFKVVRSDNSNEENEMADEKKVSYGNRKRRVRNADLSSLLFIEFPEGSTEEDVKRSMEDFGLEGYNIVTDDDGYLTILRSDLTKVPEDANTVKLSGGLLAGVSRKDMPAVPVSDPVPHITMTALRFDPEKFSSEESVSEYLTRNDIDFPETGLDNTDNGISVTLKRADENAEIREVEVEEGVIASVVRSEVWWVPPPYVEVISETAYGSWGWGQFDLGAILADQEFCQAAERATYALSNLMDRVLFYSSLTIAARKDLVGRACEQYAAYINSLMDALPTKVIIANRSDKDKKESDMSKKDNSNTGATEEETIRTDATATSEVKEDDKPVTRSEVVKLVAEGVAAGLAAAKSEPVERSDQSGEANEKAGGEGETEGKEETGVLATVLRSVEGMAESIKGLTEKVSAIEGATVVRSDGDDSETKEGTKRKDPFAGVLGKGRKV